MKPAGSVKLPSRCYISTKDLRSCDFGCKPQPPWCTDFRDTIQDHRSATISKDISILNSAECHVLPEPHVHGGSYTKKKTKLKYPEDVSLHPLVGNKVIKIYLNKKNLFNLKKLNIIQVPITSVNTFYYNDFLFLVGLKNIFAE